MERIFVMIVACWALRKSHSVITQKKKAWLLLLFFFSFFFLLSKLISFCFFFFFFKGKTLTSSFGGTQYKAPEQGRQILFSHWVASYSFLPECDVDNEQERGDWSSSTFCRVTPNTDFLLTLLLSCHSKQVQLLIRHNTVCLLFDSNVWLSLKHLLNSLPQYCKILTYLINIIDLLPVLIVKSQFPSRYAK